MSLFHKHSWRLIAATDTYDVYYSSLFPYSERKDAQTRIILKCDVCDKLKHDRFTGHIAQQLKENYEAKK